MKVKKFLSTKKFLVMDAEQQIEVIAECIKNAEYEFLYCTRDERKEEIRKNVGMMEHALKSISDGGSSNYRSYPVLVPMLNSYYYSYSTKAIVPVALLLCLVVVLVVVFRDSKNYYTLGADSKTKAKIAELVDGDAVLDIVLPDYNNLEVSKKSKLVELSNPTENDFYLQYSLSAGEKVLCNSIFIKPGDLAYWDAYTTLSKGENAVSITVSAYNLDSQRLLGSATEVVTILKS